MIFLSILSSTAAILAYVGLLFLLISIRQRERGIYLQFALSSLFYSIHLMCEIITLQQSTIPGILLFFKPQVAIENVAGTLWIWTLAQYTQVKPRKFLWLVSSIFLLLAILQLVLPYGILWKEVSGLQSINLPWGESYFHLEGTPHPLVKLSAVTAILTLLFFLLVSQRKSKCRSRMTV